MVSSSARRVLSLGLFGLVAFGNCASACDPLPDECDDDDNVCAGNVANRCASPYPEGRMRTWREDCGSERTCVVELRNRNQTPLCARAQGVACAREGERACEGALVATCVATNDGRLVWVDSPCPSPATCTGNGECR